MKTIKSTVMMMGISAITAFSAPALAADAPAGGLTFGIVDMNKVVQTTDAAKDIFSQMEVKRKEYQTQIAKEEDSLRSAGQELEKQKDTLSKEAFESKGNALREKFVQEQKVVDQRKKILDLAFNGAMGNLRHEAAKIVDKEAKARHYSAVLLAEAVMMSTPELDMTDVVIEQMNQNVKKIPVDWTAATDNASSDERSGKRK